MTSILIVNHTNHQCGVYQYGYNTTRLASRSTKYNFVRAECNSLEELIAKENEYNPGAIIYNYHSSTIGWVNTNVIARFLHVKHLAIHHEPHQPVPRGINIIISQDPLEPEGPNRFSVPRILHDYSGPVPKNEVLTIGTFGFGLGGKGYDRLVERVQQEFDEAHIRMHIPYAHYGDQDGFQARGWADVARSRITKPGITLSIDHDWFVTEDLLKFLAGNDLNFFMYDDMARGISGVLDFALSVPRPLAITGSLMFKHVWQLVPNVLVEHNSLVDILARGIEPLKPLYEMWSNDKFTQAYERIIDTVLWA